MEAILSEDGPANQLSSDAQTLAKSFVLESGKYPIYKATEAPDLVELSESDIMVPEDVAENFGHKSFDDIYDYTHALRAYTSAWHEGTSRKKFPMKFEDFFLDAPGSPQMLEELLKDQAIREAFAAAT